jgi:hypothetical protein
MAHGTSVTSCDCRLCTHTTRAPCPLVQSRRPRTVARRLSGHRCHAWGFREVVVSGLVAAQGLSMCAWQEVVPEAPRLTSSSVPYLPQGLQYTALRRSRWLPILTIPRRQGAVGALGPPWQKAARHGGQYPLTSTAPPSAVGNICLASVNAGGSLGVEGLGAFEWCDDSCLIWRDAGPRRRISCKNETGI